MSDRESSTSGKIVSFGPFHLNSAKRLLKRGGKPIRVGGRALDLLITLVERAGEVVGQRELISLIWPDVTVEDANLRVHLAALRKALGDGREEARYIVNVPGRGYSFVAPTNIPSNSIRRRRTRPPLPIRVRGCRLGWLV